MTTRVRKVVAAALVSAASLGLVVFWAKFRLPDLSKANPFWLAAVLLSQLILILARASTFRALASTGSRVRILQWIRLAARHQLVFSVIPGGIGDAGFPYLAKRIVGMETSAALKMVAQIRLRDAICVAIVAFAALMFIGLRPAFGFAGIALALPALWFADELAAAILRIMARIAPGIRLTQLLREASKHEAIGMGRRAIRTISAMLVWVAAIVSIMAIFRAIGISLSLANSLLFVTALNAARAISLSIAGLGVSEAGAAAALVASGATLQRASSLALITRPALLVLMISLSLFLDVAAGVITRKRGNRCPQSLES